MLLTDQWIKIIDLIFQLVVLEIPEGIITAIIILMLWIKLDPAVLCRAGGLRNYAECVDALMIPALVYAFTASGVSIIFPVSYLFFIPAAALFLAMIVMLELNKAPGNAGIQILQLFASLCIYTVFRLLGDTFFGPFPLALGSLNNKPSLQLLPSLPLFGAGYAAAFCILASGSPLANGILKLIKRACYNCAAAGAAILLTGSPIMAAYYSIAGVPIFALSDDMVREYFTGPVQAAAGLAGMIVILASVWGIKGLVKEASTKAPR